MDESKRFKSLPTEEEWARFKEDVENVNARVIMVPQVTWTNEVAKNKQTVYDIPIFATVNTSERPRAISYITRYNKEDQTHIKWVFNQFYSHINISSMVSMYTLEGEKYTYEIAYQSICNPITMHHFYEKEEKELTLLFQGQLMGQNTGSRWQTVVSPYNNYTDKVLQHSYGGEIYPNAPVIQLLTRKSLNELKSKTPAELQLLMRLYSIAEDEVYVKYIENAEYTAVKKEEIMEDRLSHFYPIITYEQVREIHDKLPKTDIDFACFGLGSAGTGILDQVGRSTYFKSYLLVDMDAIEAKNLRNQWYTKTDLGYSKVSRSKNRLYDMNNSGIQVEDHCKMFQDLALEDYNAKYVVSGFDSLKARRELFDKCTDGTFNVKYLIDARYDDLSASLYFIDLDNEEQVALYARNLAADMEAFEEIQAEKYVKTKDEFLEWITKKKVTEENCVWFHDKYMDGKFPQLKEDGCAEHNECTLCKCWREEFMNDDPEERLQCKAYFESLWDAHKDKWIEERTLEQDWPEESSCVRQNFIDIYKYASSFIFAAIREIETDNEKPFTYMEVQTDKVPTSKIIK